MGKRDELIAKYADDLKNKCKMTPDMALLEKVVIGCGPAIYNADAETVAASQASELELVKNNFLIKKLGLKDSSVLATAYECGIPIFTSSPGDSSIGMNVAAMAMRGSALLPDVNRDVNQTAAIVYHAKSTGHTSSVFILGGE